MPPAIEPHLADFAELASTAISAAQTRAQLRVLADEQAALRRVAELVARGAAARRGLHRAAPRPPSSSSDQAAVLLRYDVSTGAAAVRCRLRQPRALPARRYTRRSRRPDTGRRPSRRRTRVGRPDHEYRRPAAARRHRGPPHAVRRARRRRDRQRREQGEAHRFSRAAWSPPQTRPAAGCNAISTTGPSNGSYTRCLRSGSPRRPRPHGRPAADLIDEAIQHAERANSELRDLVRGILPPRLPAEACAPLSSHWSTTFRRRSTST